MTPRDLPDLASLWQEQIDPAELGELRALAKTIGRTAARRRRRDDSVGIVVFALFLAVLLAGALKMSLGIAIAGAAPVWAGWKRHRIARAARTLVADEPRAFFAAAIANARAELGFSRLVMWAALPYVFLCLALVYAGRGLTSLDLMRNEALGQPPAKMIAFVALLAVLLAWVVRAHRDAGAQLRQLERMSGEWDEQEARDWEEGADRGPAEKPE